MVLEKNKIPVRQGEVYNVVIEALGEKGDGIAKIKGYAVFVKNVNLDDQVNIKITRALDRFGFAEVV